MRAVVTGGEGYIGKNLVKRLLEDGHEVIVWDDTKETVFHEDFEFWNFCITSRPTAASASKCDVIFHLAAMSRIQPAIENPEQTYYVNIVGTLNVLECAKQWGSKVVFASTCCCKYDPYSNPYSFSKYQGEEACKFYADVETQVARIFNVYGNNEISSGAYSTVVGVFKELTENGMELMITGDGTQRRDFVHVDDVVDALMLISKTDLTAIHEIGNGVSYSINEVAEMFQPGRPRKILPKRDGENKITTAYSMTMRQMGWKPKIQLEDYIKGVVDVREEI